MADFLKTVTNRWQDSLNFVLGLWLIISPWALQFTAVQSAFWNAIAIGVIVAAAAFAALIQFREWEEWAGVVFGLWLAVSPWVLGFGTASATAVAETGVFAATWNFVIVGVLTIAMAIWSLRDARQRESRPA